MYIYSNGHGCSERYPYVRDTNHPIVLTNEVIICVRLIPTRALRHKSLSRAHPTAESTASRMIVISLYSSQLLAE
jgi:hypothetical protein